MKKKIVVIPVEISAREGMSRLQIATALSEKGFICVIGSKRVIFKALDNCKDLILLDKGYDSRMVKRYRQWKKRGHKIISLDEEGAIDAKGLNMLATRYNDNMFDLYDKVLFWGQEQRKRYANTIFKQSKSVVTGNPRFVENTNPRVKTNGMTLVCTNMGWGNNVAGIEHARKNYSERVKSFEKLARQDILKIGLVCEFIREYVYTNKKSVVIRVHAEESSTIYREELRDVIEEGIVKFDEDRSIAESLERTSSLVHCDSTCAIEAVLMGVKAYSLCKNIIKLDTDLLCDIPIEISRCSRELHQERSTRVDHGASEKLRNYFSYTNDKERAISEICRAIWEVSTGIKGKDFIATISLLIGIYVWSAIANIKKGSKVADEKFKGWSALSKKLTQSHHGIVSTANLVMILPHGKYKNQS